MMRKTLTLLPFLIILIFSSVLSSNLFSQSKSNDDEGVESVNLEMEKIIFCPWARTEEGDCDRKRKIEVSVVSPKAEKEGLDYYYLVNGGEIIGKGSKVIWDFSKAKIGKYTITVGVGNNSIIIGKTITKSFTLEACQDCDGGCVCPSLTIFAPTTVAKRGDTLIFTANLAGGTQDRASFRWSVSAGTIIAGQGTSKILVKTTKDMKGQIVTATVEVGGLCADCPQTTGSYSVEIK